MRSSPWTDRFGQLLSRLGPAQCSWLAVLFGLALRAYHYLRCPTVWQDEAALMVNVLRLPFEQFFGPLKMTQAAPPLFLGVERLLVVLVNDSEYTLRLFPFFVSCLGLILVRQLMMRVLTDWWPVLAVTLLASSDRLLWHSCEAKPYAIDVSVAILVAWYFVRTESWSLTRRCLPAIVVAPVLLWMSFPACFVLGGFFVGLLPSVRPAPWTGRGLYVLLLIVVGIAFLALILGPAATQRNQELDQYWANHYPDWQKPWTTPGWILISTLDVARYCFLPIGFMLVPFAAVGGWRMLARGDGPRLAVALLPWGLVLLAACLKKYPYSSTRLEMFLAPGLAWVAVEGAAYLIPLVAKRSRAMVFVLLLLLLVPSGLSLYRVVQPWPRDASDQASAYVLQHKQPGDRVVFNHWEYEYYFRSEQEQCRFWLGHWSEEESQLDPGNSLWVIHNSKPVVDEFVFERPVGRDVAEMTRFPGVRVFRLTAQR